MSGVFVDTYYHVGLLNPADQYHQECLAHTQSNKGPFVTTAWVLVEVANALCDTTMRRNVVRFFEKLKLAPDLEIVPATMNWFDKGMSLYAARTDKTWSLTDCISMEVMRERGIQQVLTGDHHFTQAGFQILFEAS